MRSLEVTLLFERSFAPIFSGVAFALLVTYFAWSHISHTVVGTWLAIKLGTGLVRAAIHIAYQRRPLGSDTRGYERAYLASLVLDGAVWGLIGTWLVRPDNAVSVAVALATLVGISAVGSHVFAAHGLGYACFTLPILIPTAAFHAMHSGNVNNVGAVAILGYLAQSALDVRRSVRTTRELARLRYEVDVIADARARALLEAERSAEERESALAVARASNDAKSRFLATMSHEMRTPLNGVLGALQLLERRVASKEDASLVNLAESSGRHLLSLIDDVLGFAELESESVRLEERPFDIRVVVDEVVAFASRGLREGVVVRVADGSLRRGFTMGDPSRCRQVLSNLVQNGAKFSARGAVDVTLRATETDFVVSVRDDGIGIDAATLPHIFDPFQQADDSLGRRFEGVGLGLPIARELARAMGGDVVCAQSSPGKGSTFELRLPRKALPDSFELPPASTPPPRSARRARVMLVDDNELNALLGHRILEELGVEPIIRMGGAEAVLAVFETKPDMVFMDIQMPGVDGVEATRRIRLREGAEGKRRVPIVALTAHDDRARFLAAGMDDYIGKPYRLADIAAAVARFAGPVGTEDDAPGDD